MSFWFINTLLVTLAIGIIAFINKIFAQRKYDQKFSAMVLYGIMSLISFGYFLLHPAKQISLLDTFWISLFGLSIYVYSLIMMTALRYLPTSTYFVNVRLISSFILLFVGIIFFQDHISLNGWIGFFVGVIAMTLLFEQGQLNKKLNYTKGIILLLAGVVNLVFGHTLYKYIALKINEPSIFLLITSVSAFLISFLFNLKNLFKYKKDFSAVFKINIIQAILFFYYFILLFKTYQLGSLGLSYKIQSYSSFIPIILSAIIYKEKISTKKKIALVLVAISLWFFR